MTTANPLYTDPKAGVTPYMKKINSSGNTDSSQAQKCIGRVNNLRNMVKIQPSTAGCGCLIHRCGDKEPQSFYYGQERGSDSRRLRQDH